MAYIPSECSIEQYNNAVYNEDAKHKLYIKVGNNVLEEPDNFCEKLTIKSLLLANGDKHFALENFISKEATLILHDYLIEDLTQDITIKIGTYINEQIGYVYVPMGLFKIQDTPTNSKNKTTYKLRDKSVNFDFNYNAKPLIDKNGGKATKRQIVLDICEKANITFNNTSFVGEDDEIGIYDNSITARVYISYIASQSGSIATINRNGELIFIPITNNLYSHTLPYHYVQEYSNGRTYEISKTIFEMGTIKFESGTDAKDILYIDSSNPYVANQEQLERIQNVVNGFKIDSFKINKILGSAIIDPYDFITTTDDVNNLTFKTLGQNTLTYNGKLLQTFETNIEYEERQTNTTNNGLPNFKAYVKQEIDNINNTVTTTVGRVDTVEEETTNTSNDINNLKTDINNNYTNNDDLNRKLAQQKDEITKEYTTQIKQSAEDLTISVTNNITTNGVSKLKNSLITIDINGINVAVNTSAFNTQITNEGFYCRDSATIVAKIDRGGLLANNPKLNGKIEECGLIQKTEYIHSTFGKGLAHFYMG